MPLRSVVYRILIASPSDMADERQAATDAIHEWNAQHAIAESAVLLPVKWETHATPQAGIRPQEAINAQLVRDCDMLVGMFWTKIGTSTGIAESGTVEEIDQFVAAGKPAMLYLSNRPIEPSRIDLTQLGKLRDFAEATYKTALVGTISRVDELRNTILRDLMRQVRRLKPAFRRLSRTEKLDEAHKLTELIRFHRQHDITPEQFDSYRELLGLRPRPGKAKDDSESTFTGLFFDYGAIVAASINTNEPDEGWACLIEIVGENYETKKFEAIGIAVNMSFDSAGAAIDHGKELVEFFGVECIDTRIDEL
jgi:hypothetical protein